MEIFSGFCSRNSVPTEWGFSGVENHLFLIYINKIGTDYKGNYLYDFIFSDKVTGIDGQDWDLAPSSGRAEPPNEIYIKKVGRLETVEELKELRLLLTLLYL
jgi:hypothetical protein